MKPQILDTRIKKDIMQCLHYFDIFNHPLTLVELKRFLSAKSELVVLEQDILGLMNQGLVIKYDKFYALAETESKVKIRLTKEKNAAKIYDIAIKNGRLISRFPFNECVCISGSLSKGLLEDEGDIDYFIISTPGRIWISKFFLKLYKVFFLNNSKEYFCINYIIATDNLEIKEKNLFTSTEIETLKLVYNKPLFDKFVEANQWYKEYIPGSTQDNFDTFEIKETLSKFWWAKVLEKMLSGKLGDAFDAHFQKMAKKRNQKKYQAEYSKQDFELNFRTDKNEAKIHPPNHQNKVMNLYQKRVAHLIHE